MIGLQDVHPAVATGRLEQSIPGAARRAEFRLQVLEPQGFGSTVRPMLNRSVDFRVAPPYR
jgi:hypothetical protein